MVLNGNREAQKNVAIIWENELRPFVESDINRSAWFDAFQVDELNANGKRVVTYRSDTKGIPVRKLAVQFEMDGTVSGIDAVIRRSNALYTSEQELNFIPDVSYSVKGWQRTLLLSKTEFEVQAQLVK